MTCLELRRKLLTEPDGRDVAAARRAHKCRACRQFAARTDVFEDKLGEAIAVSVPAGLSQRIAQRLAISEEVHKRQLRPLQYAIALGAMLAVALVCWLGYRYL